MKKEKRLIINTGTTSLILIFAVLALVVFALLSLSASSAQWRLTQRMQERMEQYYTAENAAQRKLLEAAELLETAASEENQEDYFQKAKELAEDTEGFWWEDGKICWETDISEKQKLYAAITPVYPKQETDQLWKVEAWKLTEKEAWGTEQGISLLFADPPQQ